MKKTKIIGCGSMLMGDDAVGCIIAQKLREMDLPGNVEVIEAGTPGINLLNLMEPGERVIIVDAVVTGKEPGTLHIYTEEDLPKPKQMPISAHQLAIPEAIALGRQVQPEMMPDNIEVWGIDVQWPVEMKFEMSDKLKAAVSRVVDKIKAELLKS